MVDEPLSKLHKFYTQYNPLHYKKKSLILHADDTPEEVFYIKEGFVRAYRISEQGEELTIIILKPRDFFPVTYGLNTLPNSYYLEAMTSLQIWKVPRKEFMSFLKDHPDVYHELTNKMMARFGGLLTRMEYLVFGNAYTKVATTILICAKSFGERWGENLIVTVPFTHKDIAAMVGITRETACLEMKKLERKGLIGHLGRLLIIKDIQALEEESLFDHKEELLLNNSL